MKRAAELGPVHDALRLFFMCKNMEWNHLPAPGGIFDQDPELLECFRICWEEEAASQQRTHSQAAREAEAQRQQAAGSTGPRRTASPL